MLTTNELINERSEITNLSLLYNDNIAYCTEYHGARLLDNKEHKTLLKVMNKELRFNTTALCFNPDATLLAFANESVINILHLNTKKIIKSIKTNESIIMLTFCAEYIIAGTQNGRVLQYRHDNSALLARVCSFPYLPKTATQNFVSAFAVHGNYLACSGYGGAIFVLDIYAQATKKVLLEQGERINALCFIDEHTLISANNNGTILVHDLHMREVNKKIDAPFKNIRQIQKMPNSQFIAISGNENYIAIADINKAKIIHSKYIEFKSNISKMLLTNDESLLVVLSNHKILQVNLPSKNQLRMLLIDNEIEKAYMLVENEPMLYNTNEYKILEKRYDSLYKEALAALMNQNKTLAHKTLSMVQNVHSKREDISKLFAAFNEYNRFKVIYLEKKYAVAYAMGEKYVALKQTPLYLKMEENFKSSFIDAQRHIIMGKDSNAKVLLNPYVTVVAKRPLIKLLLNKDKDFINFLNAIKNKNFQTLEELITQHPIFVNTPTYAALNQTIETNISRIDTLINEGKLPRAKELLLKFKNTTSLNNELKRLYTNLDYMQKLQNAYKKNDFKYCYELLDAHHQLNITPLGVILNKHWAKLIRICEDYALKANPKGIKETLDSLLLIDTRKGKIGDLLRVSFQSKIKAYLSKKGFGGAQNIIYSYIDIFGLDNEIKSLMRTYELMSKRKLAITQQEQNKDRNKWMESEFITDLASD
ncbi:MAG: hypothetical protein QM497_10705 [Sulfurimonas sp.]